MFFFLSAFIPYPLLFGYVMDKACLVWEEKCGQTGNCWIYDHEKFRHYLHGWSVFFIAIGSLFDFITIFYSDRVRNFYEDDEKNGDEAMNDLDFDDENVILDITEMNLLNTFSINTTKVYTDL